MTTSTPNAQSRIPRPSGLTLSIRKTQSLPPKQRKIATKEIYKTIIRNYIQQGLTINGQVLSINQLGIYLNLTYKQVMIYVGRVTNELAGLLDPNQLQANYRALLFQAINNSLADRGRAELQFEAMYRAQADKDGNIGYKPFVSGTVNIALTNLLAANKGMMDVASKLVPNPTIAIQNNYDRDHREGTTIQHIGTEEAIKLIQAGQSEGAVPSSNEDIYLAHEIEETPDVRVTSGPEQGAPPLQINPPDRQNRRLEEEGLVDAEEME